MTKFIIIKTSCFVSGIPHIYKLAFSSYSLTVVGNINALAVFLLMLL